MAILLSSGIYGFISSLKKTAGEYAEHFLSGFSGYGWKIWEHKTGRYKLEIDDISVRGSMTIYELLVEKMRAIKGSLGITQASGRVKDVSFDGTNYLITIEDEMSFVQNDIIRCQSFDSNASKSYWVTISSVIDGVITIPSSEFGEGDGVPEPGDEIVQFGNTTDANRQSAIYLHTNNGSPAIDIMYGINSKSFSGCVKLRLGAGISGENQQYQGLYCENGLILSVNTDGNEMYKFNPDGSGHFAKGAISWDTSGKVTFSQDVSLSWSSDIETAKSEAVSAAVEAANKAASNMIVEAVNGIETSTGELVDAALITAASDAQLKADAAKNAADAAALAQIELAVIAANAYADGVVTAEEARAIADANAKLKEAKDDAQIKADDAKRAAIDAANKSITESIGALSQTVADSIAEAKTAADNAKTVADAITKTATDGEWGTRLTYIDSKGIFTGKLSANVVEALEINAVQIKAGTISSDRINVNELKSSILTADNINSLSLSSTKGTIGGWNISEGSISFGTIGSGLGLQMRSSTTGTGLFYSGAQKLSGISIIWHRSSNAGHLVMGQIARDSSNIKAGFFGIQMMDHTSNEFFCLSTNTDKVGGAEYYNRIAGWSFDTDSLHKGTKKNSAGFTGASGDITIGSNGIRGFKWRFESDGSGSLAGGNISWNSEGAVTFGDSVKSGLSSITDSFKYLKDILQSTTTIQGGLLLSSVIGAKDNIGNVKSYISGVGSTAFAAGVMNFGTPGETRMIDLRHDGTGKIGILQIDPDGKVKIFDTADSSLVRIMFSDIDLPSLPTMLSSNSFSGSVNNTSYQISNGTLGLPNTINVTHTGAALRFIGTIDSKVQMQTVSGTAAVMNVSLELYKDGVRWGVIESWTMSVENRSSEIFPKSIDVTKTVEAGNYQVKVVVTASGNINTSMSIVYVNDSTTSWSFKSNVRRFEFGKNGFMGFYTNNHIYYTEAGGLDVRGNTNIPGVLGTASCDVSGALSNKWGSKIEGYATKIGTGHYRVYHSIGHNEYTVNANAFYGGAIVTIATKTASYFEAIIMINGTKSNSGFDYTLFGKNY